MKLYKKLPIIYLITFLFYAFAGIVMLPLTGFAGYLLTFWFVPVLMALRFINTIAPLSLSFLHIGSIPFIFISDLIFWFFAGLLIDKIFDRVKNGKWQTTDNNLKPKGIFLFFSGLILFSLSLICQFVIVGIDSFAAMNLPITFLSLYIIPVIFLFLKSINWSFSKKILVIALFIIYLVALARLLTFLKTGDLIIKDDNILRYYSTAYFSRNSEYGAVLTEQSMSENDGDDKLYLFNIVKKSLNPISTGIPIISNNVSFSPNGDKILYGYGRLGKSTKFTKGADSDDVGLRVFNVANGKNDEIISTLGEYSFKTASKHFNDRSKERPYLYGWIDENKIAFSCTKESEMMRAGFWRPEDDANFLYCVYDSNTDRIETIKNMPKLFDGNLTFSMPYDPNNWKNIYSIPNSNNKIRMQNILPGFDGSTAVEIYLIEAGGNEKLLYRGHFFDSESRSARPALYTTFKGNLFIKKNGELIKIY